MFLSSDWTRAYVIFVWFSSVFVAMFTQWEHVHVAKWILPWTQDQRVWCSIFWLWSSVEVSVKLNFEHYIGLPTHSGHLVHGTKVRSIGAGCIGGHLAREKAISVKTCVVMLSGLVRTKFTLIFTQPACMNC